MKGQVLTLEQLGKYQSTFPVTNGNGHVDEKAGEEKATTNLIPEFEIPDLALPAVGMEIDFEAQAAKLKAGRTGMAAWVAKCLGELNKLAGLSEDARYLAASKISELTGALHGSLTHDFPPYRRAAWVALFQYEFGRDLSAREEVEKLIARLVSEGRLVPCKAEATNRLEVYRKFFVSVSPEALFEDADLVEVKKTLASLLARVYKKVSEARQIQAQNLPSQTTMSLAQFLNGQPGRVYLDIPAIQEKSYDGQLFWRSGGGLLLASDGENASPLGASGAIEGAVREAMDLRVHLRIYTLRWETAPMVPGLDINRGKKVQFLWYLINRAMAAAKFKASQQETADKFQADRQELIGSSSVETTDWFLNNASGKCVVSFPVWNMKDETGNVLRQIRDLALLIDRREDGAIALLSAVATDMIEDIVALCGDTYVTVGDRFDGMPYPQKAFLQAGYGQALRASQNAAKSAQI